MTLLEEAKKVTSAKRGAIDYTDDLIELCVAWVKDEITLKQFKAALRTSPTNSVYIVARVLKHLYQEGRLIIK